MSQIIIVGRGSAQAAALGGDPHFASVVLLSGFEGTDGSTTFDDESASNHALTAVGNAQIDTAQFKFGASSALLDGTGDRITAPNHANWWFDAGNFTIETFVRFASVAASQAFCSFYDSSPSAEKSWWFGRLNTNVMRFYYSLDGSTDVFFDTAWTPSTNTWYHVAAVRDGTTLRMFVDGTELATQAIGASDSLFNSNQPLTIGMVDGGFGLNGWLDEMRITKGVARYTANFTPPSEAFPRS